MRPTATILLLCACLTLVAASPKKKSGPAINAPDAVPHTIALFLRSMSKDGARQVTFRANAHGTRFFIEEPAGVTVYRFNNGNYVKETFVRGAKLPATVRKYSGRQ
jgi:hypothetical protein